MDRFGHDKTSYILSLGTISDKGTIDEIGRALEIPLNEVKEIKDLYDKDPDEAKQKYPDVFYYFDGMLNTVISQGFHPAGILASPVTLPDNYGVFQDKDDKTVIYYDMEEVHECGLVKYDILGLKNVGIIQEVYKMLNKHYPKSYEINWDDKKVWEDIKSSPVGIFQYESDFAFDSLKKFNVQNIDDLTLVNACIRPSGTTYRDDVFAHKKHKNPSTLIDEVLKSSLGYLVYQEQTIAFLQEACGLTGGEADNVRRAIGRKQKDRLDAAMPQILEGYCNKSEKPRKEAEKEVKEFLQVIEDSASYQFGFNHATAYSMIGYLCAYLRYYYPAQFVTAFLNLAANDEDIKKGTQLAEQKHISIISPKFRHSVNMYSCDNGIIYKGTSSIKGLSKTIGDKLYSLKDKNYPTFLDLLIDCKEQKIGISDLTILAKLDYFSEFGTIGKILKFLEIYNKLYGKKIIKKDQNYPVKKLYLKEFCAKETEKQYTGFNSEDCLRDLFPKIPNEDIPIIEKLNYQLQYFGYVEIVDSNIKNSIWFVTDIVERGKNKIVGLYKVCSGEKKKVKLRNTIFNENPFKEGSLIDVYSFSKEGRWLKDKEGNWEKSVTQFEDFLTFYEIKK